MNPTPIVFSAALLLAAGCTAQPEDIGHKATPIIGGSLASVGQFPTAVGVIRQNKTCSGVLVAPDAVLTAGHCIEPASTTRIAFDATELRVDGTSVSVSETHAHPAFEVSDFDTPDVGIIRLDTPVTDRAPSPINFAPQNAPIGIRVEMVGYGRSESNFAPLLRSVANVQSGDCSVWQDFGVLESRFLCYDQRVSGGQCRGDSGGPSFVEIDGVRVVVGVSAFGSQNCEHGVDTRTDTVRDFIGQVAPDILCRADGFCDSRCAEGQDADCGVSCTNDDQCDGDSICNANGTCVAAPLQPGGIGAECSDSSDCTDGVCAGIAGELRCVVECRSDADCRNGYECGKAIDDLDICLPADGDEGGCNAGTGDPLGSAGLILGVLMLLGVRRRTAR